MFVVPYKLDKGEYGIGVFAVEAVPKGVVVYDAVRLFQHTVPKEVVALLSKGMQDKMQIYGYTGVGDHRLHEAVYYDGDDSRFFNHSDDPSLVYNSETEEYTASRKIKAGEEFTIDYADVCVRGELCFAFAKRKGKSK